MHRYSAKQGLTNFQEVFIWSTPSKTAGPSSDKRFFPVGSNPKPETSPRTFHRQTV